MILQVAEHVNHDLKRVVAAVDSAIVKAGSSETFYPDPLFHVSMLSSSSCSKAETRELVSSCEEFSKNGDDQKVIETFIPFLSVRTGD